MNNIFLVQHVIGVGDASDEVRVTRTTVGGGEGEGFGLWLTTG